MVSHRNREIFTIIRSIYEESGRKCDGGMQEKFTRSSCASLLSVTCNNAHFNYPRSASVSISMQITEVAILLEKKRKTNEDVKEEGRKRKGKWSGIMRKSEKKRLVSESGGGRRVEVKFERFEDSSAVVLFRKFYILFTLQRFEIIYLFRQECFCSIRI